MSSSSGAEEILITSPHEQQANAPVAKTIDAKLMLATGSGDVQHLKNLVNKQEDSEMMVVVMAKQQAASSMHKPHPPQGNMDPHLLALASSGSSEKLQALLNGEDSQASGHGGTDGSLTARRASSYGDDTEANESILEGVTAEGDTALHVVAASGQGDNFCTRSREAKALLQQNNKWWWWWWRGCWCLTSGQRQALLTTYGYGDGENFLKSARTIYGKANHLLFAQNNNGDTPLHCAARAEKSNMVKCLIHLAANEGGEGRMKELLRKENKHKETALHEAVRVGNKDIVNLLMYKDSELASVPRDGGTSPMYLAIMLRRDEIVKTLYENTSDGKLISFSGPNGRNALHAAALRHHDLTELLERNKEHLRWQNKDLTTQRDDKGSTPLHLAAAINIPSGRSRVYRQVLEALTKSGIGPSINCRQVLDANPDALYQQDHDGFSPLHVAASVGAFRNVDMFVKECPGSAGLRDAHGRTFLHVAVEKKEVKVITSACRNLSLSWIMNMVDDNGNTALHLAIKAGSLRMFSSLLGNPQVKLNLPNNRGETPLDTAKHKLIPKAKGGLYYTQSREAQILMTLINAGADSGVHRGDHFKDELRVKVDGESKEALEVLKDSTGTMCIGSVLIATVTFGATFAMPGGYIEDDHSNGGSPVLARRYAFDAFIASNTLAFVSSTAATFALMHSGSPVMHPRSRKFHLVTAYSLVWLSITCLAAAFALGAYVVLAPVAHKTAIATCVFSSLVLLHKHVEFIWIRLHLLQPLCTRKGPVWACVVSAKLFFLDMLFDNWALILIFGWAVYANQPPKILAPAPAPAPASLA